MALPNPLDQKNDHYGQNVRILSDKGIRQALQLGLIKTTPSFDPTQDGKRIQPATLDVKIQDVDEVAPITDGYFADSHICFSADRLTIPARSIATINLTELIDFGQLHPKDSPQFFGIKTEARSSIRRLGMYMANCGAYFFSGPENSTLEWGNFSPNDILFTSGERVAQLFFTVYPFADKAEHIRYSQIDPLLGEAVRSLDMGVEVTTTKQLRELEKKGFLEFSPKMECRKGKIIVRAGTEANRFKKLEAAIEFSKRDSYTSEMLLEPFSIAGGYTVQPFEHLVIEVQQQMKLSPHVGILFWDNLFSKVFSNSTSQYRPQDRRRRMTENIHVIDLPDGWVDPGYSGGFSRQPKWLTGRTIHPGDILGDGQVFFFPQGVGTSYGSAALGSQYQNKKETEFSK